MADPLNVLQIVRRVQEEEAERKRKIDEDMRAGQSRLDSRLLQISRLVDEMERLLQPLSGLYYKCKEDNRVIKLVVHRPAFTQPIMKQPGDYITLLKGTTHSHVGDFVYIMAPRSFDSVKPDPFTLTSLAVAGAYIARIGVHVDERSGPRFTTVAAGVGGNTDCGTVETAVGAVARFIAMNVTLPEGELPAPVPITGPLRNMEL